MFDKNITYWEKNGVSNSFQISFNKSLTAACIQLYNYALFEKAQLKLSPLIQNRVQQDYLPESYARHLPSYQKCHKIVAPTRYGLVPPSPEPSWVTLGMGKNPTQQPKIYSFPPSEKSPLIDLNLSLSKVSFLPHQTAIFK